MDSEHSFELRLTPDGRVTTYGSGTGHQSYEALAAPFEDHEAGGLIALAASTLPPGTHASVLFWRDIAAAFLRVLCHIPETDQFAPGQVEPPEPARLTEWVQNAPPMEGAEYLTPAVLSAVWQRLLTWTNEQIAVDGSLTDFLHRIAPQWVRVGRVTLHLAENRNDAEFPFAFMATYAAGMSRGGRLQRLPMGQALKEYAGARRKPELIKLLSPLHAAAKRSPLIAELVESGDVFHPLVWTPDEAYAFLKEIPVYEECGLLTQLPNWWRKRAKPQVSVTIDRQKHSALGKEALLAFDMSLALGGQTLSDDEAQALLNANEGLMLLRGEWVEVNGEQLQEALEHWREVQRQAGPDGLSFIEGMRLLAGASTDLKTSTSVDNARYSWAMVNAGDELREMLAGLRQPAAIAGEPPRDFRGELRRYQLSGLNWLWFCSRLGLGCCLADDMGLGKTIQVLAALVRVQQETPHTERRPSLLIVPASLLGNWRAEAVRFAPTLTLLFAHPSETPRQQLDALNNDPAGLEGVDLVVTTYSMLSRLAWVTETQWNWVILDEAQAIKNPATRQTKTVKRIRGATRVALTGTPVENRLGDLWSIFDFINPGLLGSATRFKEFVKTLTTGEHTQYAPLRNLVAPYILRRLKTDSGIASDLPDKTEMQVYCGLSRQQTVLYQKTVEAMADALEQTTEEPMKRRGLVLSTLMRLKQICNHPSQLTGDAVYAPEASAKFQRLGELCTEIASRGEKVLVFSQFREITDPLADYLATVFGRPGLLLHGGIAVKKRSALVATFQRDDGPPFIVMSIKAGGTGLNLTRASHVIHFDRWWNPAVENQATDRAFRIGQTRNVLVHKFVTRGTIEERIDEMIRDKQEMADALLKSGGAEKQLTEMNDEELLQLVSLDIEKAGA